MPVELSWLIKDKVIYTRFIGDFTLEEQMAYSRYRTNLLKQSPSATIHSIQDFTELTCFSFEIQRAIQRARKLNLPSELGNQISFGIPDESIMIIAKLLNNILQIDYYVTDTYEDALNTLQSLDAELPTLNTLVPRSTSPILCYVDGSTSTTVPI